MIRDLIKWVMLGLATVLAGTTLCLAMTPAELSDNFLVGRDGGLWSPVAQQALAANATARLNSVAGGDPVPRAPASVEIAQARESLAPSGSIVILEVPRIEDYWMSATRQAGGIVVFDGYVPDEATRNAFAQRDGADVSYLKLGRGAPERYRAAADFALDALARMSVGRVAVSGAALTISGTARSGADYALLLSALAETPQGVDLTRADILPPRAETYSWAVSKDPAGTIALSGHVPNPDDAALLLAHAGQSARTSMTYASGEPGGFATSARTALDLLQWLAEGRVSYDGQGWTVTGTARSATDKAALEADFMTRRLAASGWSMAVAEAPPAIAQISPYIWSATRADNGVTLMGHVPNQQLKQALADRAGTPAIDKTAIGRGAPTGFESAATAGLDAVLALDEGEVGFDGIAWSLTGRAESEAQREALLASLARATNAAAWHINVSTPAPEVPQTPEPASEPVANNPAVDPDYAFSASRAADGAVLLSGQLPSERALRYFSTITSGDTAAVTIAPGSPDTFLSQAERGLRALVQLQDGQLDFQSGRWSLKGVASDAATRDAVMAAFGPDGDEWLLAVDLPAAPQQVVAAAASAQGVPVDISACAAPVAAFSARNAILFQSGAAVIAAGSEAALDELARDLEVCPDAVVHVEGHTDSDGDEGLNMALSVARAEAVINALIARGILPARLYAIGYGESAPIADNGTAEGKRLNRRIVVSVQPEHY